MRRNRLYRNGVAVHGEFRSDQISSYLAAPDTLVWLDMESPDESDQAMLAAEFDLSPPVIEDIAQVGQRMKVDHYADHNLLNVYGVLTDPVSAALATNELAVIAGTVG
ncbi:MAG: hypothetical protein LH477_17040 [Nocardioides sp.]|nr:hypothetical protein [Nocardioides sp.]